MHISSLIRRLAPCIAVVAVLTSMGPTAGATSSDSNTEITHCVVSVIDQLESGEYVLSDEECYSDFSSAMESVGLGESADTPAKAEAAALSIQSTLATHYDGASYTGSSFSVLGINCLGGYVNMSASWDNRVSSTYSSFCPRVRHWTGVNLSGQYQDTLPSGNLSSPVNNTVSSIQYLT
ncbi:MAG TPA: hypothetical protein PLS46_14340 [Microthrixaceae bacterium]|nr:hypothetical protein [Microthrixaceae bacterium]